MKKYISFVAALMLFCGSSLTYGAGDDNKKDAIVIEQNSDTNKTNQQKLEDVQKALKEKQEQLDKATDNTIKEVLLQDIASLKAQESALKKLLNPGIIAAVVSIVTLPKYLVTCPYTWIRNHPKTTLALVAAAGCAGVYAYYVSNQAPQAAAPADNKAPRRK